MVEKSRQASAGEIEITEEMIEAGVDAYREWYARGGEDDYDIAGLVKSVFEACLLATAHGHKELLEI